MEWIVSDIFEANGSVRESSTPYLQIPHQITRGYKSLSSAQQRATPESGYFCDFVFTTFTIDKQAFNLAFAFILLCMLSNSF